MRRLFLLALAIALLSGGVVYAANDYALPNATVFGASGGPTGVSPATQIIKVRYARMEANAPSLASGDVVSWDEISADGITISGCVFDSASSYAGILVTTIATADTASKNGQERNWGYMAVQGYCLAKVDTSNAQPGQRLVVNGGTLSRSLSTTAVATLVGISPDIGVLLRNTGSDTLMPVYLTR